MKNVFTIIWSLLFLPLALPAASQDRQGEAINVRQAGTLQLNVPIEREIGPGQTDSFTVAASARQLLHVVVQKEGVNTVVAILSPDGRILMTGDDPPYRAFGTEPVSAIAVSGGEYQIRVSKSPRTAETGRYRIELTALRIPADQDQTRLKAETLFYAAVQNERLQGKENRLQAIEGYKQAAELWGSLHDDDEEALCLHRIVVIDSAIGEYQKAIEAANQALPLWRFAKDLSGEAMTLTLLGHLNTYTGKTSEALDYYNKALPLEREAGDRESEASTLQAIGTFFHDAGSDSKALGYYDQAFALRRALGDRQNQAYLLTGIGLCYQALGENLKALDSFNQSLSVNRALKDQYGEAGALIDIGLTYRELGDDQTGLVFFKQALELCRVIGDRHGESFDLYDIGLSYLNLGKNQEALAFAQKALPVATAIGDQRAEALAQELLGLVYLKLAQRQRALKHDGIALALNRAIGDHPEEVWVLISIGEVYSQLGERQKALNNYVEALHIASEDANLSQQSAIFADLMITWKRAGNPELAIFFGKQAINLLQQMRANLHGAGQDLEKQFLVSNDDRYRTLANLLIDQGRLPEAQQVLNLLKEQEYTDYVRGDPEKMLGQLSLTPAERQAEEDYQKSTAQLISLSQQWSDLKKLDSRTSGQEQQFQQLSSQLGAASKDLHGYFARLYVLFGENNQANKQVADVKSDVSVLEDQIAETPHTVALYTIVSGDRYRVIVVTPEATVAREFAIFEKDLNRKISAFQQSLRDPAKDPKPLAEELYKILIGPIRTDLDQAKAQTLVWSLDGPLRYIPMSALFDGRQYLVEKYNLVAITPASISRLGENPNLEDVNAVAMGISRKYQDDLVPLPTVVSELDNIVRDPRVEGANGVLPGSILLNDQFTEKAMENKLDGQHSVVHIASHFVLKPGDDTQSYLLLAGKDSDSNGYHLTLADFRDNQNLALRHTDLLTLSACETGVGGNTGNGREVDGLATMAQLKGAKAVISSLWEVDDASTGALMADFYKRWAEGSGKVTKVEALRVAQLDLLKGKAVPQSGTNGRGFSAVASDPSKQLSPAGYSHPYYWAPFVLTGNWR